MDKEQQKKSLDNEVSDNNLKDKSTEIIRAIQSKKN